MKGLSHDKQFLYSQEKWMKDEIQGGQKVNKKELNPFHLIPRTGSNFEESTL